MAPYLPALAASIAAANDETKRSSLETLRNQASGHTAAAPPSSVMNSWGHTGKHLLVLSFTGFDPIATLAGSKDRCAAVSCRTGRSLQQSVLIVVIGGDPLVLWPQPLIVAAFAGLALIIVLAKMGMSNQAGNEHAGTVKGATPSVIQVPDWTIFDHAFANEPTRLTTSEFVDRVRTSSAALTPDSAETTGQVSVR